MMLTHYVIEDIEDYEDFLNKLCAGLKYYQSKNPNLTFKLSYDKNHIILKTMVIDGCLN